MKTKSSPSFTCRVRRGFGPILAILDDVSFAARGATIRDEVDLAKKWMRAEFTKECPSCQPTSPSVPMTLAPSGTAVIGSSAPQSPSGKSTASSPR